MHKDSLTAAQRRIVAARVKLSHHREIELVLLTKDGDVVASFTNAHLGGVINGDTSRTPAEVCEIGILDPDYQIAWARGEHRKYDLQVIDSRFVPELDEWVWEEIFTGPIWDFEREGIVVKLVAQGSERKAMGSVREVYTANRKSRATVVLRDLLGLAGALARDVSIPPLRTLLPRRVTVGVRKGKRPNSGAGKDRDRRRQFRAGVEDTYWAKFVQIAEALDRDAFPDGRGRFLLRAPRTRPSLHLSRAQMLGPAVEKRGDDGEKVNTWLVLGANPKGPKKRIRVEVGLPPRHPSSAKSQRWNEKPRKVTELVDNPQLSSKRAARRVGERKRDRAVRDVVDQEIHVVPFVGWVRPRMLVSAPTPGGRQAAPTRRWSVPLGPGADPLVFGGVRRARWLDARIVGGGQR